MAIDNANLMVYPQSVQAGVLKPHGRQHTCYILCQFRKDKSTIKRFIRTLNVQLNFSSHLEQMKNAEAYNRSLLSTGDTYREKVVVNFGLSCSGMRMLEMRDKDIPPDRSFRNGLASLGQKLPWYPSTQTGKYSTADFGPFEAIIVLAHSSKLVLTETMEEVSRLLAKTGVLEKTTDGSPNPVVEYGISIKSSTHASPFGPLGYRDGLSEKRTLEEAAKLTLVREESFFLEGVENKDVHPYGTFMFYQKIKLNNHVFKARVNEIVNHPSYKGGKNPVGLAEALLMGRFKSGTPLAFSREDKDDSSHLVKMPFDYGAGNAGELCPFNAHVRVSNPREDGPGGARIVRRGTLFGKEVWEGDTAAEVEGVHFVSLQKSIHNQLIPILERMQKQDRFDPITYGKDALWEFSIPKAYLKDGKYPVLIQSHDKISEYIGGGFFYLPSLSTLALIADDEELV